MTIFHSNRVCAEPAPPAARRQCQSAAMVSAFHGRILAENSLETTPERWN
jgi:hypothetical protein